MFAYYYDLLMEDIDYDFIMEPLLPFLSYDSDILDAGCGTGHILKYMLNKGYRMTGIDNDEQMLLVANKKIDTPDVLFYHDLNKPINREFDAILMLFDVANYFSDIKPIFNNIYQALNHEGVFIFDIYKKDYLTEMKSYHEEDDYPFVYTWDTHSKECILYHDFKTDEYELSFKQFLYDEAYYEKVLNEIGFNYKKIEGNDDRKNYYICHK